MMKSNLKKKVLTAVVMGGLATSGFANVAAAEEGSMHDFVLDAVVVTASRIPTTITEAKADISLISREEIELMHMENVEEALRTVPGVQFLNYGANGANANLSGIRINGSKDVVILVDGVRMTDFQGANNSGYMFASLMSNMENIERIEVLRGSAATVYGSGAKGGVINIITRAIEKNSSTISVGQGTMGKEDYKFTTQGKIGKVSYNAYHTKNLIGDTKDGEGKTWEGRTNATNNGVKVTYEFEDDNKLTVSYDKNKSAYSGQDYIYSTPFAGTYDTENTTVKHDYAFSDQWSNSFTYRENDSKSLYTQEKDENGNPYEALSDYSYKFISDQVVYNTSRHAVVFGLDYSKGQNNVATKSGTDAEGDVVYAKRSMENYSYYIQDDWEIIPDVTLSGGIRYDKPEADKYGHEIATHTSKSYKLSYDITDGDTIYAGRSDFYILPSMEQLHDKKYGNANLKPAEGRTTSIGYNKTFDDRNILTVNWFETESSTTIGFTSQGEYKNFDDAVDRGWNAQFMSQISDHWNVNFGWSHLFHDADGDNFSMGYYPKDKATIGVYYNLDKFDAGFTGFYFMRKTNPEYSHLKGWPDNNYGVYNLSLNYRPTENLKVFAKIDNIFDKLWAEHTNVVHGGEPGSWYSMPGRSFYMGMELKF